MSTYIICWISEVNQEVDFSMDVVVVMVTSDAGIEIDEIIRERKKNKWSVPLALHSRKWLNHHSEGANENIKNRSVDLREIPTNNNAVAQLSQLGLYFIYYWPRNIHEQCLEYQLYGRIYGNLKIINIYRALFFEVTQSAAITDTVYNVLDRSQNL